MGTLYYLCGKSASGKDTVYRKLLERAGGAIRRMVIYTTRPIRDGETDGVEYHFVGEDFFSRMKAEGKIIEERAYHTVYGLWRYFTADCLDLSKWDYLGIGTLESFVQVRKYYGEDRVIPLYIEVEDGERLKRAIAREESQETPKYEEMCRRFLADCRDFSEEKIREAGIARRFYNSDADLCADRIEEYMRSRREKL